MRIGYLYDLHAYPPKGGNHRHAYELTQGFVQKGHTVCVVDDPTMPNVTNFNSQLEDIQAFNEDIDVLYVRIDARSTRHWKTLSLCMARAKHNNVPVVWEINSPADENLAFSWLGGMGCSTNQKKEGYIRIFRRWFHAFKQQPSIMLEERHRRKLSQDVIFATCVSSAVGMYAEKKLGIKYFQILPNGGPIVSESEILSRRDKRKSKRFTILYTGSAIYPWQGLNFLYRVIDLAKTEAPELRFVLAVNQRIVNLPQLENVIVQEKLDQEQVRDAICAADVCVALIPEWPWAEFGFHGSPTKLFEYMAFMTPVLTSEHGQMRDIIVDGIDGLLCKNDPNDILEKLIYLKTHPELAKSIGRKGWERIKSEFNWQHNADETLKCFEQALHELL